MRPRGDISNSCQTIIPPVSCNFAPVHGAFAARVVPVSRSHPNTAPSFFRDSGGIGAACAAAAAAVPREARLLRVRTAVPDVPRQKNLADDKGTVAKTI